MLVYIIIRFYVCNVCIYDYIFMNTSLVDWAAGLIGGKREGQRRRRDRRKKPEKKRGRERGTGRREITWRNKTRKRETEEEEKRHG